MNHSGFSALNSKCTKNITENHLTEFSGVLRLNKETLSQSSDRHGYHFLLPKQTYLNVDEDAALTLERKRNYVYCLIVQIMKNEKEMHIDNLVFMVKYGLFCMWPIHIYIYDN